MGDNRDEDGRREGSGNKRKRKGSDGKFRYEKRKGARKRFS